MAFAVTVLVGVLAIGSTPARAEKTNTEIYVEVQLSISCAHRTENQGDHAKAIEIYKNCYTRLLKLHEQNPDWQKESVLKLLNECKAPIEDLSVRAKADKRAANQE